VSQKGIRNPQTLDFTEFTDIGFYHFTIQTQGFHPCLWLLVIAKSFIFGDFPRVFLFHFREFQEKRYQKGINFLIA
jgi:hypothetical protein